MIQHNADVVLLTNSVNSVRTIGAYRVATELRNHGYSCQIIEHFSSFTHSEVVDILDRCIGPDTKVLGISSTFTPDLDSQYNAMSTAVGYVRQQWPEIKIVVGGAKARQYNKSHVDVQVIGLADLALPAYLKFLGGHNPFFQYEVDEQGIMLLYSDRINQSFDFQHSQVVYHDSDLMRTGETLPIELSRGCIFKCRFCNYQLNGKKNNEYIKDMNTLREELVRNYNEYGVTRYIVMDDTHNDNVFKLESLARMVQSLPFRFEYAAYLRIDLMRAHPESYQLLQDTGLVGTFFGIESLHWPSARVIGKGLHPDKTVEELYRFRDRMPHVGVSAGFIVGLPYETPESLNTWVPKVLAPGFPVHHPKFNPLYVEPSQDSDASEFDREFDRWFTRTDRGWHNGSFDFVWAQQYVDKLNGHMHHARRVKVGGFVNIERPHLGISDSVSWIDPAEFDSSVRQQINDYKTRLLL